jgi:RNA polymerase sigma-70 factor (ECF subfamily)
MVNEQRSSPDELIRRARDSGDLGPLLDYYRGYLKVIARLQIGSRLQGKADASDIVQETLLKVHRTFLSFRGSSEDEWLAWLRQILASTLANFVRHYVRTQGRDVKLEQQLRQEIDDTSASIADIFSRQPSPSQAAVHKEQAVILASLIEKLPEDYQHVVIFRHFQNLSFSEIGERMQRSVGAAKKLWARALIQLRQLQTDQP